MSNYNTGNPVPSTDPRDLDDNATVFDNLLMQPVASVPDRLGVQRKTWWKMEQDAAALVSPNVSALAAAVSAANKLFYFTGSGTGAVTDLTAQARTFLAAATQATQRTALGLGTMSTVTAQTANTDATAGRGLLVGAFGWNGGSAISQANTVDADTVTASGFYAFGNGGINLPTAATAYYLRVSQSSTLFLQEAYGMTAVANNLGYWRVHNGTAWQPWNKIMTGAETGTGAIVRAVSPALTGTPTAPTAAVGTNTTQLATTAMIQAEIANKRAWTTYTPTVTANTGTFTTASATGKYMVAFGICHIQVVITITTQGTGVKPIVTVPFAALAGSNNMGIPCSEVLNNGRSGMARFLPALTTLLISDYINGDLITSNGCVVNINGSYPIA